jgi:hypothetical protein
MRKPINSSHTDLLEITEICTIDKRRQELNEKYFINALRFENEMVIEKCKNYSNWYPDSRTPKSKPFYVILEIQLKPF